MSCVHGAPCYRLRRKAGTGGQARSSLCVPYTLCNSPVCDPVPLSFAVARAARPSNKKTPCACLLGQRRGLEIRMCGKGGQQHPTYRQADQEWAAAVSPGVEESFWGSPGSTHEVFPSSSPSTLA